MKYEARWESVDGEGFDSLHFYREDGIQIDEHAVADRLERSDKQAELLRSLAVACPDDAPQHCGLLGFDCGGVDYEGNPCQAVYQNPTTSPKDFEPEYEKAVVAYKALERYFVRELERIHEAMMDGERHRALQWVEALLNEAERAKKLREIQNRSKTVTDVDELEKILKELVARCPSCVAHGVEDVDGNNIHISVNGYCNLTPRQRVTPLRLQKIIRDLRNG